MEKGLTPVELERIHAEISKMMAETARISDGRGKMDAAIARLMKDAAWHPVIAVAAAMGAASAATAIIIKRFTSPQTARKGHLPFPKHGQIYAMRYC